ncbi:MAG TPA: response regulator [Methylomirabilota bacterium]|nr:response regulator [Methylomirabilota bacterium]
MKNKGDKEAQGDKEARPLPSQRFITTGEAATHCQVSMPALRRWIRDGKLGAFQTPGKHARIEVGEFQRFLREYGMPPFPRTEAAPAPRVLVVEDEPDVLQTLVRIIAAHSRHAVIESAVDGYDALIKVGVFKPSFIVMDVVMPRLDGLEVCRRLRANPETKHIKILAVTGRSDMVRDVVAAGADVCITKPFDFASVEKELDRFLRAPGERDLPASPALASER